MDRAYARLPAPLQSLHRFKDEASSRGRARVTEGDNAFARLVARAIGFPRATADCPVEVVFSRRQGVETWQRAFGTMRFKSTQEAGSGRWRHLIIERFGPLAFGLAVLAEKGGLRLVARRWSAVGLPMPGWLLPRIDAFEHGADGRFNFSVDIGLPGLGRLVKYEGWLQPSSPDGSPAGTIHSNRR